MPRPRPRDDTYWRFTYPSLNKAQLHMRLVSIGSLIGGNVTRNVLVQGLRQYDFGQLEYQRCSDDEIRKFALDQGIVNPNDFATSRTALLTKLQKANESRTFGRSASCHRNSASASTTSTWPASRPSRSAARPTRP